MDTTDAVVPDTPDQRADLPMLAGERESLEGWLELSRETLLLKVAGLTAEQLITQAVPPSSLSPIGIIRHLTEVEAYWLRVVLQGEDHQPYYWRFPDRPDADFDDVSAATAAEDVAAYSRELDASRAAVSNWPDLDRPAQGLRHDKHVNLRWILTHLIEEYSRHLGHIDLLREVLDGRTGY